MRLQERWHGVARAPGVVEGPRAARRGRGAGAVRALPCALGALRCNFSVSYLEGEEKVRDGRRADARGTFLISNFCGHQRVGLV